MRSIAHDPWEWMHQRGIEVRRESLEAGRFGEWHPAQRLIIISHGLTDVQERCALTHECGHAIHHHQGCLPQQERAANRWAADRLIDADDYAEAEQVYGLDLHAIAVELGVMDWVVEAWREGELERRNWSYYFAGQDLIA